jgi:hypothetical protein
MTKASPSPSSSLLALTLPYTEADEDDDGKPLTKAQIAAKKLEKAHDAHFAAFPVVITTYDLIIRDRPVLGGVPWG